MTAATNPPHDDRLAAVAALLDRCRAVAVGAGRQDLASRLDAPRARLERPDAVLCVVGEFKQGKSALVNGLLGAAICPVDDDLATASVTLLRYAERASVRVRGADGTARTVDLPPTDIGRYVSERTDDPAPPARLVEAAFPNAFLARGISVVDTPGVGGLNAAHAAATLAFLPSADAVIFVSDGSSELSAEEIDFLRRAGAACPTVLFALTKIDLYPAWRRIAEIDARRLSALDLSARVHPVSSVLRARALAERDADLNLESGFPQLLAAIASVVGARAVEAATATALADIGAIVDQLRTPLAAEIQALAGPDEQGLADELERAHARLAHLRGPAARWPTRLSDGFAALGSDVDYRFRGSIRRILRDAEEELDKVDPARTWPDFSRRLQLSTAEALQASFAALIDGVAAVEASIVELLAEGGVEARRITAPEEVGDGVDVRSLWTGGAFTGSPVRSGLGATWNALRGAQGGVLTLGVMGGLVGLTVAAPVLIGAAVFFGGKQIAEDRKRQLSQRRTEARTLVRQYLDDLQFEAGTRLRDLSRVLQQRLRDGVAERVAELDRTYAQAAARLERAMAEDAAARESRHREVAAALAPLDDLVEQIRRLA